jgi:hypothetical protein
MSDLGQFLADFAASNEGSKVSSEQQPGSTQCWDLAMAAVEHAQADSWPDLKAPVDLCSDPYSWSDNIVDVSDAQAGDIVQWVSWNENHNGYTRMTGPHHTSIVAEPYDGETLKCWGQNPSPVTLNEYHPADSTGGSMTIFRLDGGSGAPHSDADSDQSDADNSDADNSDADTDGYQVCGTGRSAYYWKAAEGYDPYTDGYYWYWPPSSSLTPNSPDQAEWYWIPK